VKNSIKSAVAIATSLVLFSGAAFAQGITLNPAGGATVGDIAKNINSSLDGVTGLVLGFAYVAAFVVGLMGLFYFKKHNDDPQRVPLSKPIVWLCVSAGLAFLPTVLNTGAVTIWGTSTQVQQSTAPSRF